MNRSSYKFSASDFAALAAIVLLAAVVVFAALPNSTRFMHVLHKTGHPVVFGLIALLALSLLTKIGSMNARPLWVRYFVAFIVAVLLGAATEIAQLFTHRGAALADVMRDAVGAIACLAAHAAIVNWQIAAKQRGARFLLIVLALASALGALAPLIWCLAAYAERDAKFPVILRDPSRLDMYFVARDEDNVSVVPLPAEASVLRVAIDKGAYPGLQVIEPYPRWSKFSTLAVDITNPGQADVAIVIRVHDRQHTNEYDDRFNRDFVIGAGKRVTLLVALQDVKRGPKRRTLDLDAVANVNIFAQRAVNNGEFYVNGIWLQ
jgi:VanZ family protein